MFEACEQGINCEIYIGNGAGRIWHKEGMGPVSDFYNSPFKRDGSKKDGTVETQVALGKGKTVWGCHGNVNIHAMMGIPNLGKSELMMVLTT
jgi:hypothetical protein